MREDQYQRLQALEDKLLDVFFEEADPDKWPGKGLLIANMDAQQRGDRYWVKRNAAATLALTQRIGYLVGRVQMSGVGVSPGGQPLDGEGMTPEQAEAATQLEHEVMAAEREAAALMKELRTGTMKARFDRDVHGKKPR